MSGYILAKPGIPIILSPKSILIVDVSIFDDESEQKVFDKQEALIDDEIKKNEYGLIELEET